MKEFSTKVVGRKSYDFKMNWHEDVGRDVVKRSILSVSLSQHREKIIVEWSCGNINAHHIKRLVFEIKD